jgi:hypothetical protein
MMPPRKSGTGHRRKAAPMLAFSPPRLGHSAPGRCPTQCPQHRDENPLGSPLSIHEVAELIGCSVWTVRQTLIPLGLPVFRSGTGGKLIFYRHQVIRWIEDQQGGNA